MSKPLRFCKKKTSIKNRNYVKNIYISNLAGTREFICWGPLLCIS